MEKKLTPNNTFFHRTSPVAASEESFSFVFFIRSFNFILLSHCIINSARLLLKFCRVFCYWRKLSEVIY